MVAAVVHQLGPVDVLVNNAGLAIIRGVEDITEEEFDLTIAVNLKSAFLCTQAVVPAMRARKWGRIVNISSGAARGAGGVGVHYNASKAGMEGLTRGYAARLVKDGITGERRGALADRDRHGESRTRLIRSTAAVRHRDEVRQVVLMLVGNAYMTGQTVPLSADVGIQLFDPAHRRKPPLPKKTDDNVPPVPDP